MFGRFEGTTYNFALSLRLRGIHGGVYPSWQSTSGCQARYYPAGLSFCPWNPKILVHEHRGFCAIRRLDYPSHGSIHTSSKLCSHFWNATGSSSAWATTSVLNPSLAKTSMCFTVSSIAWMQWYVRNDFRLFGVWGLDAPTASEEVHCARLFVCRQLHA